MQRIFFAGLMMLPLCGMSQQIVLDLSQDKLPKQSITPGTKEIVLTNTLSRKKFYKVSAVFTDVQQPLPPVFTLASLGGQQQQNGAAGQPNLIVNATCPTGNAIASEISDIKNAALASEADVKKAYDIVKAEIAQLADPCKSEAQDLLNDAILNTTAKSFLKGATTCQLIFLTIERYSRADSTKLEKIWLDTLETTCPQRQNQWLLYYGFTYQPNIISKYDRYFAKSMPGTTDSFSVTKMNGNQTKFWENISPTVMFTYLIGQKYHDFKFGISAIAATNFSTYSAGLGISGIIGYNLNIGTGIVFTQKSVLNGMYKEGDIIRQNLTFDQLHEKKWGPELFFTIALRFDKNPFSGSSSSNADKASANKTPAKPATP